MQYDPQITPESAPDPDVGSPHPGSLTQPLEGVRRNDGTAKGSAVGIALLVHVLIFMLLAFIVIQTMSEDVPELIVESSGVETQVKVDPKK